MLTEKEKIQRARMYMYKLSVGIDPISQKKFDNDAALNSEVLGRTLDGIKSEKKTPERRAGTKEAFYITPEERSRVKLFDEDCVISEFTNAVNKAVNDTSRKKLQAKTINDWLVNEGYLINSTDANGRTRRELTERSAEIGISSKQGINALGSYTIILYSRRAQEFILENIDKII